MPDRIVVVPASPLPPKPWYKSMTLWGGITAVIGAVTSYLQSPAMLSILVWIGLLTTQDAIELGPVLAAGGGFAAIWGRIRAKAGAPLILAPPPPPPVVVLPPDTPPLVEPTVVVVQPRDPPA